MDKYLVECEEKPCCEFGSSDYHFKNAQTYRKKTGRTVDIPVFLNHLQGEE